jgi:hypothetical protein
MTELWIIDSNGDATHLLLNLLAIIHGDGGHYTDEWGLEKSVEDAVKIIYKLKEDKFEDED